MRLVDSAFDCILADMAQAAADAGEDVRSIAGMIEEPHAWREGLLCFAVMFGIPAMMGALLGAIA